MIDNLTHPRLQSTYNLLDLLCRAAGLKVFAYVIEADAELGRDAESYMMGWRGGVKQPSRAQFFAGTKALELLASGNVEGITLSPLGLENGCLYMGGIRKNRIIIACSALSEEADLTLSLVALWHLENGVRLHNAGWTYPDLEAYKDAVKAALERHNVNSSDRSEVRTFEYNFSQTYITVADEGSRDGVYWEVHRFSATLPSKDRHIDIVVDNPTQFLNFMHTYLPKDTRIYTLAAIPNAPIASITVHNGDETLTIFVRQTWSEVADW